MYIQYMFIKITTHIYTYIYIFLSTPVENPANSSNPVKSGLVFEMVKSGPVPAKFQSGSVPARIPDLVAHCYSIYQQKVMHHSALFQNLLKTSFYITVTQKCRI